MSANIYAVPVSKRKGFELPCSAPSNFLTSLERAFSCDPHQRPVFSKEHCGRLEGMAAMYPTEDEDHNPYLLLIHMIDKHGEVELQVEY